MQRISLRITPPEVQRTEKTQTHVLKKTMK